MTTIEQRILATIARARREDLHPKSLYLSPEDRAELPPSCAAGGIDGLPVRAKARAPSMLYCRHGIGRAIRADRPADRNLKPWVRPPP